jgi:hypothetical protein
VSVVETTANRKAVSVTFLVFPRVENYFISLVFLLRFFFCNVNLCIGP